MVGKGNDCLFSYYLKVKDYPESSYGPTEWLRVRCGHCVNCRKVKAQEWNMRNEMEAQYWDRNSIVFTTLTYDPKFVPINYVQTEIFEDTPDIWKPGNFDESKEFQEVLSLDREEVKKFFKRLRKHLDYKIRYYCVGEYGGSGTKRPHLHALIFGLKPEDWHYIQEAWNKGFVVNKAMHDNSAQYISQYVQKKLYGDLSNPFKRAEFLNCSQHLGERWFMDHLSEFDSEHPYINFQGYKYPIPRTFMRKLYDMGKIRKLCAHELRDIQMKQSIELFEHLRAQGISESEYFHQRIKNAVAKARKATANRIKEL